MISQFLLMISHFMDYRYGDIDTLPPRDKCRLMANYLREIHGRNPKAAMDVIINAKQNMALPLLLADLLDGKHNGSYSQPPTKVGFAEAKTNKEAVPLAKSVIKTDAFKGKKRQALENKYYECDAIVFVPKGLL